MKQLILLLLLISCGRNQDNGGVTFETRVNPTNNCTYRLPVGLSFSLQYIVNNDVCAVRRNTAGWYWVRRNYIWL